MHTLLESQFRAALAMLRAAIESCPDDLWNDPAHANRFWRIAYHAIFYAHLYLSASEEEFVPWERAIPGANFFASPLPTDEQGGERINTADDLLAYAEIVERMVNAVISAEGTSGADLAAAPSGFAWIPFSRLELHIYNLRHVQHHAGQLIERLRSGGNAGVDWVGMGR